MKKILKKILIITVIFSFLSFSTESLADDSTISYIRINNIADNEVEIFITDKGNILVPFKQLADIFQIKYKSNKAEKEIKFITFDEKYGVIKENGIFIEDVLISKQKPVFVKQGITEGLFNEAYIPADIATLIMNAKITTDFENLTLAAQVDRDIPAIENKNYNDNDDKPKAYKNIYGPDKSKKFSLNTIGLHSNMQNNYNKIVFDENELKNDNELSSSLYTGSTQLNFNGRLLDGKYRIEATENHYEGNPFMFGGVTGTYRNKFTKKSNDKKYYYELGKVKGIIDDDIVLGSQIFGAQIWNYDNEKNEPRKISGYVDPSSLVQVSINGDEPKVLSTYAGYYTLKDLKFPNIITSIKIDELKEDGTVETIFRERYSTFGKDTPFENETRTTAYMGIWGYQNKLFREGNNIYKGLSKKFTLGAEYKYGYQDNITSSTNISFDKIYDKPYSNIIYRIPTNDYLLVSGTSKSNVFLEGTTILNSLEWKNKNNSNVKAKLTHGFSFAEDIREKTTKGGYIIKLSGDFEKNLQKYQKNIFKPEIFRLRSETYHSSPDYYVASSDYSSNNDRTGAKAKIFLNFNSTVIHGSYNKYFSNFNHKYQGGLIAFDEASAGFSTKIPKAFDVRLNGHFKQGENRTGRNQNYNFDANISRNVFKNINLQAGRRENYYNTTYKHNMSSSNSFYSKYDDDYVLANLRLPKKFGTFILGHNIVHYETRNYKNDYQMASVSYTVPIGNHFSVGTNFGYKYKGQRGNNIGFFVGYQSNSGRNMTLTYQYSQNTGYFIDNYYTPTTNCHTITFNLNDAFMFNNHWLKSIGNEDINKGVLEVLTYIDVNNNGIYDKKIDVPINNVPLISNLPHKLNNSDRMGKIYSKSTDEGIYDVKIDIDNLPFTIIPAHQDNPEYKVRIEGGKTTKIQIPLAANVGSVSGTLKITDYFGDKFNLSDFVVIIVDFLGKEIAYSTLDEKGEFYISGLSPGQYTLKLDESFVNKYGLEEVQGKSEITIIIPNNYKKTTDISNIEMEYRTISM